MNSEYGYKLNPHRKLCKQKESKACVELYSTHMYQAQLTKVVF